MIEILKVILLGIVEGITEWLPISSTGHMILLDEFIKLNVSDSFKEMFMVVIQLGAIMAVVVIFWKKLWPFHRLRPERQGLWKIASKGRFIMWLKIMISCVPAAVIGLLLDDWLNEHLYNYVVVALMLILYGILFIVVENYRRGKKADIRGISEISCRSALMVGIFQVLALIPGTSRSGATILGGMVIGMNRKTASEYTFFLAVPVMLGASLLKLVKFGFHFTAAEAVYLAVGMAVAFLVSLFVIRFLMSFIRRHDFRAFGWYRIALGVLVLIYFAAAGGLAG